MTVVKTAISIDRALFDADEHMAHELHISRSELYGRALQDLLRRQGGDGGAGAGMLNATTSLSVGSGKVRVTRVTAPMWRGSGMGGEGGADLASRVGGWKRRLY